MRSPRTAFIPEIAEQTAEHPLARPNFNWTARATGIPQVPRWPTIYWSLRVSEEVKSEARSGSGIPPLHSQAWLNN